MVGNYLQAMGQAGIPLLPNAFESLADATEDLMGATKGSYSAPNITDLKDASDKIFQKLITTYPKPPRFQTFVEATAWISNIHQGNLDSWIRAKANWESDPTNTSRVVTDGKKLIESKIPYPIEQPSIWDGWATVAKNDPTIYVKFPLQIAESVAQITGMDRAQRDAIQSSIQGIGAAQTAETLLTAVGAVGPSFFTSNPYGLAIWATVSLAAGLNIFKQKKESRKESERRQREFEERQTAIQEERKVQEAQRRDSEVVQNVSRSRGTFFNAISRAPFALQRFSELRPEEISSFIRRPQYASSVGLARSLEQQMGKLLKPRF